MKILAPFTPAQVEALNKWQERDDVHPFTCARPHGGHGVILRATEQGWVCPATPLHCDYTQDWAHDFMLIPISQHKLECGCTFEGVGINWKPCPAHVKSSLLRVRKAHAEVVPTVRPLSEWRRDLIERYGDKDDI